MAASPPDFSIVLPAYNEAPNVAPMLAALHEVLAPLNYTNLDTVPAVAGQKTTTEFLSRYIFDRMAEALRAGGALELSSCCGALRCVWYCCGG